MTEEQLLMIEDRSRLLVKIVEDLKKDLERLRVETRRLKDSSCLDCRMCSEKS